MEKKIFKIDVESIPEDKIDEYVRSVAEKFMKAKDLTIKKTMDRKEVYKRLDVERDYQDLRWSPRRDANGTPDDEKSIAEWITYMEYHLNSGKNEVYCLNDEEALAHVRKIGALAIRCLELHGCPERIIPEDLLK